MTIAQTESDKIYDELIAAHTIMRRGVDLLHTALARVPTTSVEVHSCVGVGRWLIEFVHQHQRTESDLFWQPLADASPTDVGELHDLTVQHIQIDRELDRLAWRLDHLEDFGTTAHPMDGREAAAAEALRDLDVVRESLSDHLDEEESLLKALFPMLDPKVIRSLRTGAARCAPSARPDLVLGLMTEPTPTVGYTSMLSSIPFPARALRPLMIARFHSRKRRLGLAA
jgi:hemerythrin-like domain-containing protein